MNVFITGPSGSGKSTELLALTRKAALDGRALVTSPSRASLGVLQHRIAGEANIAVLCLAEIAQEILPHSSGGIIIDDADAARFFGKIAEPLLELRWAEFLDAKLDPEVTGLRTPARFLEAAFRLFCRLRDAGISPDEFLQTALQGAAAFYSKPPNLAQPELLAYTKETHRSSLDVDPDELRRQFRREIDLAKILAKLYDTHLAAIAAEHSLTARDVMAQASARVQTDPSTSGAFRAKFGAVFVDDAQELTPVELRLLTALYPEQAGGVTFAGDPDSALSTFVGARPDMVFTLPGERYALHSQRRSPGAVDRACSHLAGSPSTSLLAEEPALFVARAPDLRGETMLIARHIAGLLASGAPPNEVAVIFRCVDRVLPYRDALLACNVPAQVVGDFNIFADPQALDALALLWTAWDPYAHEYLLRVLCGPALALADSSLAILCAPPPDARLTLFGANGDVPDVPAEADHATLLASNILEGKQDAALSETARARIVAFRAKRQAWADAMGKLPLCELIRKVWREGLAVEGAEESARARAQQQTLRRLYLRAQRFAQERPEASLGDFLHYAQERMASTFESCEDQDDPSSVPLISIDAARGREFDHVVIPRAHAGAFPKWYVPEAFLYSPSLGMIAKENVGDARSARTAKFTYYMYRSKARERYNREERRAFIYALRRAKRTVLVTAAERATRGGAAPEFLAELQAAGLGSDAFEALSGTG